MLNSEFGAPGFDEADHDLILDPMARGGLTPDTCLAMDRRCWAVDMKEREYYMKVFTYARVSTLDQNIDLQKKALKAAYPESTFRQDKKTGENYELNLYLPGL